MSKSSRLSIRAFVTAAWLVCGTASGCALVPSRLSSPAPGSPEAAGPTTQGTQREPLVFGSAAFEDESSIPPRYTCDGEDISPPLSWSTPPDGTESFALICDDPDAPVGTWVHWVLFNIPADARSLPAGVPARDQLPDGSLHGRNSWGRRDYGGPCPPGGTHRYIFTLYALDAKLPLQAGATKQAVLGSMDGHVLAQAELLGSYGR